MTSISKRLEEIAHECLFETVADVDAYEAGGGKFLQGLGIEVGVRYRADKLESFREEIRQIAGKVVVSQLIGGNGGHWLLLKNDPNGDEWGAPLHANILMSICNALGFMEFVTPWNPSNPL